MEHIKVGKVKNAFSRLDSKKRAAIIIISIALLLIVFYSVFTLIYRSGKTKVIIKIAPNDAVITFNDTRVPNNSTQWLTPGNYRVKAYYNDHLTTYESNITIGSETYELYTILGALDEEGETFITSHQQEYTNVEGYIGNHADKEGAKIKEKYPILNYLPINNIFYSISYSYDNNNTPLITVKSDLDNIDLAISKLKLFSDVDISSQNITFNVENCFTNIQQNSNANAKQFIRTAYQLSDNYLIGDIINISGDYHYTSIYLHNSQLGEDYAHFKVLLQKTEDNGWKILSTPQPLLTIFNTPNVDKSIIDAINSY